MLNTPGKTRPTTSRSTAGYWHNGIEVTKDVSVYGEDT